MTNRPTVEPAGRLALAIVEHGPTAGSRLATRLVARKHAVLRELRWNPMFESHSQGRGSRWRLSENQIRPPFEPLGTDPRSEPRETIGPALTDHLRAIDWRLADLERRLANAETPAA